MTAAATLWPTVHPERPTGNCTPPLLEQFFFQNAPYEEEQQDRWDEIKDHLPIAGDLVADVA